MEPPAHSWHEIWLGGQGGPLKQYGGAGGCNVQEKGTWPAVCVCKVQYFHNLFFL